jgi:hypothetical protein
VELGLDEQYTMMLLHSKTAHTSHNNTFVDDQTKTVINIHTYLPTMSSYIDDDDDIGEEEEEEEDQLDQEEDDGDFEERVPHKVAELARASTPASIRGIRACKRCGLLKTLDQFINEGCENCPFLEMVS